MNRLIPTGIGLLFFAILPGWGQEDYKLMDWKTQYTVRTYLLQKMHDQYDLRRELIQEALGSKENMIAYRELCREKYLEILGQFPEPSPLNPQITGTHLQEGYRVENVLFESLPGHHVAANFYVPEGEGPFPAALIFCGHEMTSKATVSYQKTAILFAKNGFAALVVDPISQGEMVQFTDEHGERILRGSTTEHTLLNAGANLVGTSVVTYELYDNVRSLDYLLSRPEVDDDRVGCLGNSGGGTQTSYFVGFDQRVKVAAPCSYIARRERNFDLHGADDGCQHALFEGRELLEIGDFLIMFAPKPLIILAGRYDFVDYRGTEETAEELQKVYNTLNEPEKVELFTVDDGHGISKPKREAAVRWFRRWLCSDNAPVVEPELTVLSEAELNCTPQGQINAMFPDEQNIQQFNLERGLDLGSSRKEFAARSDLGDYQKQMESLLAIDAQPGVIQKELVGEEKHEGFRISQYILRTEGEVPLPCMVYAPDQMPARFRTVIHAVEEGKSSVAVNDSLIDFHMRQGNLFILADLRGTGETREEEEANAWKFYNREYHNAMTSIHLGTNLVGQRVTDMLTLIDFAGREYSAEDVPVDLHVSGVNGPVALYAALFRSRITSIEARNTIQTYFDILHFPMEVDWYSYVIPDVLSYFDLPDLAALRTDLEINYLGEKPRIADHSMYRNRPIK
jgi:cephalosporin-C deacetylase-like acetyl esterase